MVNNSHSGVQNSPTVTSSADHSAPSPYDNPTQEFPEARAAESARDDHGDRPDTPATYAFAGIPAATNVAGEPSRSRIDPGYGRGTIDLGLLLLRLVVGGTFVYTGVQKLTRWWGGTGVDGTRHFLAQEGWQQVKVTGALVTAGELGGGVLVVLGLLTPLAAAVLLADAIDAWLTLENQQQGFAYNMHSGIVLIVMLGVATAALLLTGPGRIAADIGRGWSTRPRVGSLSILAVAVAAAVVVWVFLHGGNPFHG